MEKKLNIGEALQNLKDKVAGFIDDLASLEVTTYTGDFNLGFNEIIETNNDKFKIKSLMQSKPASLNANLKLLAYSRFEVDSDASNIIKQNLTEQEKKLLDAHNEIVKTALEARKAQFEFILDLKNRI